MNDEKIIELFFERSEQAIKEVNTDINANALKSALVEVKKDTSVTATIAIKSTEEMQFELLFNGKAFAKSFLG